MFKVYYRFRIDQRVSEFNSKIQPRLLSEIIFSLLDSASKHALLAYTDALRSELFAFKNINILSTYPGYIDTNVSINALRDDGSKNSINDEDHTGGYSPNYVAQVIIKGVYEEKKELFISVLLHRAAVWIRFFSPNLCHYLMGTRAQKKSNSKYT